MSPLPAPPTRARQPVFTSWKRRLAQTALHTTRITEHRCCNKPCNLERDASEFEGRHTSQRHVGAVSGGIPCNQTAIDRKAPRRRRHRIADNGDIRPNCEQSCMSPQQHVYRLCSDAAVK